MSDSDEILTNHQAAHLYQLTAVAAFLRAIDRRFGRTVMYAVASALFMAVGVGYGKLADES